MSFYAKNPRLKKETRPTFRRAGLREISEGRKTPIYDCDNRRSGDVGYAHDVEETTAEGLWSHLQTELNIQELAKLYKEQAQRTSEKVENIISSFSGASASAIGKNYYKPNPQYLLSLPNPYDFFSNSGNKIVFPISPIIDLGKYKKLFDRPAPVPPSSVPFEKHEAFLSQARWKRGDNGTPPTNLDESWNALQESLKPSLLDEDVLGGFGDWLENFPLDNQFLLIGDTNHNNPALITWRNEGEYIPLLASNLFTDLVVEKSIEVNDDIKALYAGSADKDQIRNLKKQGILTLCLEAKRHGIQVHALDRQLNSEFVQEILPFRHHNEERLAGEIKDAVGDRKTAVIYGASHFAYKNGLHDLLGRSNSRVINLHQGLGDYHDPVVKMNADYPAPYVFLLEEQTVVASKRNYGREVAPTHDGYLGHCVLPAEREKEISKFRQRFDVAREANPEKYAQFTVEDIVFRYENAFKMR